MDYIYRITHIDNIPHILSYGITHPSSPNANPAYVAIGNTNLIGKRLCTKVCTVDGIYFNPGDFIPFYFFYRMPMLYCISHGFGVPKVTQEHIIYLVVSVKSVISTSNRKYFFSDGHAVSGLTRFYSPNHMASIDSILDWKAIKANDWSADSITKWHKQAEFLVEGDIPVQCIYAMRCYNESAKQRLLKMGVKCQVFVAPEAYY